MIMNIENKFFTFLEKITLAIRSELIDSAKKNSSLNVIEVLLHPGWEGAEKKYQQLKKNLKEKSLDRCAGIYTLISNISEVKPIESEEVDITLLLSAYVLIVSESQTLENRMGFNILTDLIKLINNNRWQLDFVFPANNVKKIDLYGLTVEAKQITGIKGWNPSIQAHAKDLYEVDDNKFHPNDLSLFLISWEQVLRSKKNIFDSDQGPIKKFIVKNKFQSKLLIP